jgi:hypothetical protein
MDNHSQLVSLANTMARAEASDHHVGGFVRVLDLEDITLDSSSAEALDCFINILLYTNHLRKIRLPLGVTRSCITLLQRNCPTLRHMLLPSHVANPSQAVLSSVGLLENLAVLQIKRPSMDLVFPHPGWRLPRLKELFWDSSELDGDDLRDAAFLGQCHFASVRVLSIFLPTLHHSDSEPLAVFLSRHSFVEELRLAIKTAELASALLPLTMCSNFVSIGPAFSSFVSFLPRTTRSLWLSSGVDGANTLEVLDSVLRAPGSLQNIHVEFIAASGQDFLWNQAGASAELALLVGRLLPYAGRLRAHGISLIDENGDMAYVVPAQGTKDLRNL